MEVPLRLLNEIKDYCKSNGIRDTKAFTIRCLEQGFAIVKYGTSPMDNLVRSKNGVKDNKPNDEPKHVIETIVRPTVEEEVVVEEKPIEVIPPVKPKRGVKIIKKG